MVEVGGKSEHGVAAKDGLSASSFKHAGPCQLEGGLCGGSIRVGTRRKVTFVGTIYIHVMSIVLISNLVRIVVEDGYHFSAFFELLGRHEWGLLIRSVWTFGLFVVLFDGYGVLVKSGLWAAYLFRECAQSIL